MGFVPKSNQRGIWQYKKGHDRNYMEKSKSSSVVLVAIETAEIRQQVQQQQVKDTREGHP